MRDYLLTTGFRLAEDALNRVGPAGSTYQEDTKRFLAQALPDFDHLDAPVAVQYQGYTPLSIPGGMFSTADLLVEDQLVEARPPQADRQPEPRRLEGPGRPGRPAARGRRGRP